MRDAHLSNFGAYGSPERRLVFDINDFDETLPGPFEWDVKRLVASFVVAGRDAGFRRKDCRRIALTAVESYRTAMLEFAGLPILTVWNMHVDVENVVAQYRSGLNSNERKRNRARFEGADAVVAKAYTHDSLQAVGKLVTEVDGGRQIVNAPPLIVPIAELSRYASHLDPVALRNMIVGLLGKYRDTLQSDRRFLLDHFSLTDIAHKVVGVGSVGTTSPKRMPIKTNATTPRWPPPSHLVRSKLDPAFDRRLAFGRVTCRTVVASAILRQRYIPSDR